MKVLVLTGKYNNVVVFARTPSEEKRAWLYLFRLLDSQGHYNDLEYDEKVAYEGALTGSAADAECLLKLRSDYDYEEVQVYTPVEP